MGTLHEDVFTFMTISRWILLRVRNVLDKVIENIKTHILYSITFYQQSCCLWDNVENYGAEATNDVTIWRIRVECWIRKAKCTHMHAQAHAPGHTHNNACVHTLTHTHAHTHICNTYRFSTAKMIGERASVALYIHCLSCYISEKYMWYINVLETKGKIQNFSCGHGK
jgi:hypothetical protein